jgi:hypothetical protein
MKKLYTFILALLISVISYAQACDSLFSTCIGTFSRQGYYFDLEAINQVNVTGFSFMAQNPGTRDVTVYYRQGTYFGFEGNASNWTLLGTHSNVTPLSGNCPIPVTTINVTFNICIPQGQKYGFYIVTSAGTGTIESHNTLTEGSTGAQDVNLRLITGKGQDAVAAFTGNLLAGLTFQGGIQYDCSCVTSVDKQTVSDNQITVYPNPANDFITFSNADLSISQIQILDIFGKIVLVGSEEKMDVRNLAKGIYFANMILIEGTIIRSRFIKN